MHSPVQLDLVKLALQIGIVLAVCRVGGSLFTKIGQPRVNGEMFAGIVLGPSVLGWLAPGFSRYLFPPASLDFINALSQTGVIFFMFLVGLGINLGELAKQSKATVVTTSAAVVAPFALGYLLALFLFPRFAESGVRFDHFTEFLGAALSITAFPMLARMLSERNMIDSRLGTIAVACAAGSGVATWCVLAYITMRMRSGQSTGALWMTFAGIVIYAMVMAFAAKPLLRGFARSYCHRQMLSENSMGLTVVLVMVAGTVTGYLGLHPLFGAFMLGAVMPKDGEFVRYVTSRLDTLTVSLLLPLFFAFSGLRTNFGLLQGGTMWLDCGVVVLAAIAAKLGSATLAGLASGLPLRESAGLGALLNTRGLIALVVFNIGLDLGLISPLVFSMLVVMALITTVMTVPLLDLFCPREFIQTSPAMAPAEAMRSATELGVDAQTS